MRCFQAAELARAILPHTHVGRGMLFKDRDGNTIVDWSRNRTPGFTGWHESYRFSSPGWNSNCAGHLTGSRVPGWSGTRK